MKSLKFVLETTVTKGAGDRADLTSETRQDGVSCVGSRAWTVGRKPLLQVQGFLAQKRNGRGTAEFYSALTRFEERSYDTPQPLWRSP
jgi:hypothetical protein